MIVRRAYHQQIPVSVQSHGGHVLFVQEVERLMLSIRSIDGRMWAVIVLGVFEKDVDIKSAYVAPFVIDQYQFHIVTLVLVHGHRGEANVAIVAGRQSVSVINVELEPLYIALETQRLIPDRGLAVSYYRGPQSLSLVQIRD